MYPKDNDSGTRSIFLPIRICASSQVESNGIGSSLYRLLTETSNGILNFSFSATIPVNVSFESNIMRRVTYLLQLQYAVLAAHPHCHGSLPNDTHTHTHPHLQHNQPCQRPGLPM